MVAHRLIRLSFAGLLFAVLRFTSLDTVTADSVADAETPVSTDTIEGESPASPVDVPSKDVSQALQTTDPTTDDTATIESQDVEADAAAAGGEVAADEVEGVLLRFSFQEGDVLSYRKTQVGQLTATRRDQSESTLTRAEQVRQFTVASVDESGEAEIRMKFETVRMSVQGADGQPLIYHNRMKPSEVPRIFRATAFQVRRGPIDLIARPLGPEKTQQATAEDSPESEKAVRHIDVAIPLPEKRVRVGDTWKSWTVVKVRIKPDVMRDIRLLTSWKLASVENGQAKITFSTSPERPQRSPLIQGQLIEASPKGHVILSLESGKMVKRVIHSDKSVFHAAGPDTLLSSSHDSVEELLPEERAVSKR